MSVYVVAEIGSNHDESFEQGCALIYEAARAGADAVKFQALRNLPREWMPKFMEYARGLGIACFASAFDPDAIRELAQLQVPYIKIASPEIVYAELIAAALGTGIPLLISTGMASWDEIARVALPGVTLLQCTSRYPTPPEQVNLRAMVRMRERFGLPVGLSDHSTSVSIPTAAVALGASVIEKHITLEPDRCAKPDGPDHPFALTPERFRTMVGGIRTAERALGEGQKNGPLAGEAVEARGRRLVWSE